MKFRVNLGMLIEGDAVEVLSYLQNVISYANGLVNVHVLSFDGYKDQEMGMAMPSEPEVDEPKPQSLAEEQENGRQEESE